ncbi:MAG: hypothetical protein WAO55_14910 [Candidatus Manganitrophaceae bacterium]
MFLDSYVAKGLGEYLELMDPITPIFHLVYLILLNRLVLFGNEARGRFEWFVTLQYVIFLFLPFGYLWVQLGKLGPADFGRIVDRGIPFWLPGSAFSLSGLHFVLTLLLAFLWFSEAKAPQNDFDFRKVRWWSYAVVPVVLWGFAYPFRQTGQTGETAFLGMAGLWNSPFGVLPNPTSTFFLGLLTLIYPRVNFKLFFGSASVLLVISLIATRVSPLDWPLVILAGFDLLLGAVHFGVRRFKSPAAKNPVVAVSPEAPSPVSPVSRGD